MRAKNRLISMALIAAPLAQAAEAGYAIRAMTLEARGLCPACREG